MSFFDKKDSSPQQASSRTSGEVITTIISKDMRIAGEMSFKGKTRIDGIIEGNIKGEHLVLSESGKVYGDLELVTLLCHGSIEGNVKAQQVTAYSSSSLKGNLVATSLTVESGAKLNGEISSSSQSQPQPKTPSIATPLKTELENKEKPKS
jgi:cytoskeletal protein CcmA (bactofilin family)